MSDRFNDFAAAALSGLLADGAVRRSLWEEGKHRDEQEDEIAFVCGFAWRAALEMESQADYAHNQRKKMYEQDEPPA